MSFSNNRKEVEKIADGTERYFVITNDGEALTVFFQDRPQEENEDTLVCRLLEFRPRDETYRDTPLATFDALVELDFAFDGYGFRTVCSELIRMGFEAGVAHAKGSIPDLPTLQREA